jgi:hypothetical protein
MTGKVLCSGAMMFLLANPACAEGVAGTVKSVKGEVSIVRNGETISAAAGMKLAEADKIVTGPKSAVGITLQDDTRISLGAKSVSTLNQFRYNPVTRDGNLLISLLQGSMRFVTGLLSKHNPSSVSIHTPTATIGTRGTDFIVSVEGGE